MAASSSKSLIGILVIIVIGVLLFSVLNKPDDRNAVQKVGDAIQKEDTRELKDRTPAQRIGDSVQDAADKATPSNSN